MSTTASRMATGFLLPLLLTYPLVWCGARYFGMVIGFDHAALALLAVLLLSFRERELSGWLRSRERLVRLPLWLFLPAALAVAWHFLRCRGNYEIGLQGVWFFAVPLLGACFAEALRRQLAWLLLLLGAANLGLLILSGARGGLPFGLTGNWNWSATLLVLAAAAAGHLLGGRYREKPWSRYWDLLAGAAALLLYALFFPRFLPRGTMLAFLLTALPVLLFRLKRPGVRSYRRGMAVLGVLVAAAVILPMSGRIKQRYFADDIRADLATAALRVVKEHPVFGCAPGLFESAVAPHMPERYYLGPFAAERNPHPHNELLFYFAVFGPGGLLLLLGWLLPAAAAGERCFCRAAGEEPADREAVFYFFVFLLLFIHGQFDTLLANWPLDTIFLLTAGILWHYAAALPVPAEPAERPATRLPVKLFRMMPGAALSLLLFVNLMSGHFLRQALLAADRGDKPRYGEMLRQSRNYRATPENLYRGAMVELFDRRNPARALELLAQLEPDTGFVNYIHNQGLTARALAAGGQLTESLPYFEREQQNFPLGAVNLHFQSQVLQFLGEEQPAQRARERMRRNLALKGLSEKELPLLIRRPQYDVNFHAMARDSHHE